jgi:hypothetical protein
MSVFKLPLSGDVTQWISPITSWWSGNQISINLGESRSPDAEAEILRTVGSYGRQLGRISDAMIVLLRHLPEGEHLSQKEKDAIAAFKEMAKQIAGIKEAHQASCNAALKLQPPPRGNAFCRVSCRRSIPAPPLGYCRGLEYWGRPGRGGTCGAARSPTFRQVIDAAIAQLVEHVIRNDGVGGSSPSCGTS